MVMQRFDWNLPNPHEPMDSASRRVAFMLVYTAVILTLLEYTFRPTFFVRHFPDASTAYAGLLPHLWWAMGSIALYLPVPMLIIRFGFRHRLRDYGWCLHLPGRYWLLYGLMLLAVLPLVFYAAGQPAFRAIYPFYRGALNAPAAAVLTWEALYLGQFLALEFFFRGFLAIGMGKPMGRLAVWIATVPYCMIHFHKPLPEALAAIVAGLVLGEVAQRTGSIAGGVIVHIGVALTMDLLALGVL